MRVLIVLAVCISACLANGNTNGGNFGSRGQSNLIDYPFTVEVSGGSSDNTKYRTLNFQQPQQQQQQRQMNYQPQQQQRQMTYQPQQQQRQMNYQRPQQQQRQQSRSQTQYIDIPYIVESQQSQPQKPQPQIQARRMEQPRPQMRQQQPSFQIERSEAVSSFDWPSPQPQRQQRQYQQQQPQRTSFNNGGSNMRSQSNLIDYPFTVEIMRSGGSTGNSNSYYN